jgi:hypothetical protein
MCDPAAQATGAPAGNCQRMAAACIAPVPPPIAHRRPRSRTTPYMIYTPAWMLLAVAGTAYAWPTL